MTFKNSVLHIAVAFVLTLGSASSAIAYPVAVAGVLIEVNEILYNVNSTSASMVVGIPTMHVIASGLIDSNTAAGFTVTVSSLNAGNLKRIGGDSSIDSLATYSGYVFKTTGTGTLGTGANPFSTKALVKLDSGTKTFSSGAVTTGTVDAGYKLYVLLTPSRELTAGGYQDTITMTIDATI